MVSVSDFEQAVGQIFAVEIGGNQVPLELSAVRRIPGSPRPDGGFSLLFKGSREMALPQATYRFVGDGVTHDIFIVPVSVDTTGYSYEAVFN